MVISPIYLWRNGDIELFRNVSTLTQPGGDGTLIWIKIACPRAGTSAAAPFPSSLELTDWIILHKSFRFQNSLAHWSWSFFHSCSFFLVFIEYLLCARSDVEAETPILRPPDAKSWLIWKDPNAGKDWGQEEKGTTEDEMVGWHYWLNGHGFGVGQGGLACCSSWGHKESDTTEQLNWTELMCQAFPFSSYGKEFACRWRRPGLILGLGRFPWRRKWQPTPVFLSGESHGQRSLVVYSPWGH